VLLRVLQRRCLATTAAPAAVAQQLEESQLVQPKLQAAGAAVGRQLRAVLLRPLKRWPQVVALYLLLALVLMVVVVVVVVANRGRRGDTGGGS
jgi:hypothetical protein